MIPEAKLRQLKSSLEEKLIAKENFVAHLQKKADELKLQKQSVELGHLENLIAGEEKISNSLQKTNIYIHRLQLDRELKEQVASKEIQMKVEKAEELMQSLTLKLQDEACMKQDQKPNEKGDQKDEVEKFAHTQWYLKELSQRREEAKEAIWEECTHQQGLLLSLHQEYDRERKERLRLEKCAVQIDLRSRLEKEQSLEEELRHLREEKSCLLREKEEERKRRKDEEEKVRLKKKILEERELQQKAKEEQKLYEKRRDEEYVRMLSELLDEEERLAQNREEVRRRKRLEHRAVAQKVLEERRRHRKEAVLHNREIMNRELECEALRTSVMEEEERRLLLQYLPHLRPFLSPSVLRELAFL